MRYRFARKCVRSSTFGRSAVTHFWAQAFDVHSGMLAVVVADVKVEGELHQARGIAEPVFLGILQLDVDMDAPLGK